MQIDEQVLIDKGYIRVEIKEDNYGFDWIMYEVGWWDMWKFFSKKQGISKRVAFFEFGEQLYLKEELELVWTWLAIQLLIKWCEENHIAYRLDVLPEFNVEAKDQAIEEIRNRVRQWSRDNRFTGELRIFNRDELGRKLQ